MSGMLNGLIFEIDKETRQKIKTEILFKKRKTSNCFSGTVSIY